ncbi:MAG TPA: DNA polymerase/3'-5' exonuclease PolX [Gammaproteobacteria bacterium]|nr:DNA polymerase/3'-5' exonuclease PolX [Gammaproteobacteria bacterium]
MPVHNEDVARIFDELADLLEIEDANPFRVRAYRNAARTVRGLARDLGDMVAAGEDLTRLPGIGRDLASKIGEILETGRCRVLDRLHRRLPSTLETLLEIPGLGPKRVRLLYRELGIRDLAQLEKAARSGTLEALPGFGPGIVQRILDAIAAQRGGEHRFLLSVARQYAEPLVAWLRAAGGVKEVVVAGSYRRGRETVGDLDILVTASDAGAAMERFTAYDEVEVVVSRGETRSTVILRCGLQVDLRVVEPAALGAALQYFTGSKAHNIQVRRLAQRRRLKINEYGVFRGDRRVAGRTEASVYRSVGLPLIPPELREGQGEIEAARKRRLPRLVRLEDLRGDLHLHTTASDGHDSLEAMAEAARAAGLDYIAVTEHSRRLSVARGLDERRLLEHMEAIDRLNDSLKGFTLLKGIEVDILEDGSLDLPNEVLGRLDLVVGAVHSHFDLPRRKQTRRILRAMDHPHFSILAHPTGRLLLERDAYDVDVEQVIRQAARRGCFLEINAQPRRLDLNEVYCRMARDEGVLLAVNSDGHGADQFANLRYGILQARRGWLEKRHVLNTRPLGALRRLLARTMR